jgi:cell division protein FtsQ
MARGGSARAQSSGSSAGPTSAASNVPTRRIRRRYDVALGGQGVEMRLPSLPEVRVGWRLLSFGFVALLSFVLYFVWTSPFYQVSEVQVSGLERLTQRDVNAVLDVTGQPVFTVDDGVLSQQLAEAFPEFSAVTVTVDLPNTVLVTVTERVPVLIWRQEGRTELVDAEGIAFPPRDSSLPEGLAVVDALVPPPGLMMVVQPKTQQNDLGTLLDEVLRSSQAAEGDALDEDEALAPAAPPVAARQFLSSEMVGGVLAAAKEVPGGGPLTYTAGHGFMWQDPRGWEVYLGGVTDLQMKLQVYHALIDRLQSEGNQPAAVSVGWVHNPYYRLER